MNRVLAQEELVDHYKFPHHRKEVANPTFFEEEYNPSCGDKIMLTGVIRDGVIVDIGFSGSGCMLSQAAASMLMARVHSMSVKQAQSITAEQVREEVGIELGPTRLRCATLALEVLKRAVSTS